jgi:hypothetical protein
MSEKKFKKCYLHIGTEKTGSTTIQRYLESNREALIQQSHYYPKCLGPKRGSHYYLSVYCRNDNIFDDLRIISGVKNKVELENFRTNLLENIESEFEQQNCENLHISCENFQSRFLAIDTIQRLKSILDEYVDAFEVLCYLRPQHEVAISLYSTDMKLGGTTEDTLPKVDKNNHYYNYNEMIKKWEFIFGLNNVRLRLFDRKSLVDNDLISDYCHITGIDKKSLVDIKKENESLDGNALLLLKELNHYLPRIKNNQETGFRRNIASIFETLFSGTSQFVNQLDAKRFYSIFEESNNDLLKRHDYLEEFSIDFEKYPTSTNNLEIKIETVKEMVIKIIKHCFPENKEAISKLLLQKNKHDVYSFISELWIKKGSFNKNK